MNQSHPAFRFISALLLVALLASACQYFPPSATPSPTPRPTRATPLPFLTPTPSPQPSLTPTYPADILRLNGMTLSLWHPWMDAPAEALQAQVDEFNETNAWGLRVQLKGFGGEPALAEALLQAESLPEMVLIAPENLLVLQQAGMDWLDLTELVADPEWGLPAEEQAEFLPGLWPIAAQRWGVPVLRNAQFLIYNQTWAEELGFSQPPVTPQEFREQVCAAMQANLSADYTLRGTGGWFWDTDSTSLLGWLQGFGVDNSQGGPFNTPEGLQAFTFLHQLQSAHCTIKPGVASPDPSLPFAGRRSLVYAGNLVDLPLQAQVNQKLEIADKWEIIPFPSLDGKGIVPVFGLDLAIRDASHEQELGSWLFLRWLLLSRNQVNLARNSVMLPVTRTGLLMLKTTGLSLVQYRTVLHLSEQYAPIPAGQDWNLVGRALSDAAWQLSQPYTKEEDIPILLEQLDGLISELSP